MGHVLRFVASLSVLSSLTACGGDDTSNASGSGGTTDAGPGSGGSGSGAGVGGGAGAAGGGTGGGTACEPTPVPCEDAVILGMNLKDEPAPGAITSMPDGSGWLTFVDATAGGAFTSNPDSYVYGKFTDSGLSKVDISDEESLDSLDWDIAFRRYVVRINSGHSGPSCVTAARVPGTDVDFDAITTVPDGLMYRKDEYFTESCEMIPDGSGLPSSPATALSSYWTYPGCVSMTGNVFVLSLADGKQLKLVVVGYYNEAAQEQCDSTGMVPMTGTDSANFRIRWAWLP